MARLKYSDYPPNLTEAEESYLIDNLRDYGLSVGFCVKRNSPETGYCAALAPITLFPSLFPRKCFEMAENVQQPYNTLYAKIASDTQWLEKAIAEVIPIDDFVKNLWQIHLDLRDGGYTQTLNLGLFRSDYMVHLENAPGAKPEIKQVEFNTIASSFGGLSTQASKLYKYLMGQETYQSYLSPSSTSQDGLPLDSTVDAVTGLAQGIEYAHKCYLKHPSKEDNAPSNGNEKRVEGSKSAYCVLFIVQDGETNIFDQRHIEIRLSEQGIRVYRVIFDKVLAVTTVATDGTLHYHPPHRPDQNLEVTVIYYRAGYAPSEYTEPTAWKARHHLERSRAIKCPSVLTQLAGLKKVQQVLATPGAAHVEHFLDSNSNSNSSGNASVAAVRRTFAPMYPLDANSESGRIGCALATDASKATQFVLKPQREGGGNNVYRDAIPGFLAGLPQEQWEAHVLMEMIEPPAQRNVILRNGVVRRGAVICELGIYGACVWDQGAGGGGKEGSETEIFYNEKAGYLLRTKGSDSQEGGVAAGFGALDAPYLVDDEAVCS